MFFSFFFPPSQGGSSAEAKTFRGHQEVTERDRSARTSVDKPPGRGVGGKKEKEPNLKLKELKELKGGEWGGGGQSTISPPPAVCLSGFMICPYTVGIYDILTRG